MRAFPYTTENHDVWPMILTEVRRVSAGYFSRQRTVSLQVGLSDGQEMGHDESTRKYPDGIILRLSNEIQAEHIRFRILTKPIFVSHT
jgi:hypothetical protein